MRMRVIFLSTKKFKKKFVHQIFNLTNNYESTINNSLTLYLILTCKKKNTFLAEGLSIKFRTNIYTLIIPRLSITH